MADIERIALSDQDVAYLVGRSGARPTYQPSLPVRARLDPSHENACTPSSCNP